MHSPKCGVYRWVEMLWRSLYIASKRKKDEM